MKPINVSQDVADLILGNLVREYDAGVSHRRARIKQWQKNDDRVNGNVKAPKRSMHNFHIPILAGFEDTLMAKVDEQPDLVFGSDQPGEKRLGRKYDALYRQASTRPGFEWKMADLASKRDAARYGRAIMQVIGHSKPFGVELQSVDPYDFYCDPLCGSLLSRARFLGIDNIFRSKTDLTDGAGVTYDEEAVKRIVEADESNTGISVSDTMVEAMSRFSSLKLDGVGYAGTGEKAYRLVASGTTHKGVRYYCVWNPEANVLLRCQTLKEVFGIPPERQLWHVVSWAPFPDKKVFWSKAPDDDVSDVAEFSRQTLMYAMDGLVKSVWGGKVYDPAVFHASDLVEQPGGLYPSEKNASRIGSGLEGAVVQLKTPDYAGAFNLIRNLDSFVGQKSGVNPDAQGTSNEEVLGIAQQNLEQISDRMGLMSKFYRSCYVEVGQLFLYLAKHLLKGKEAVRFIGADGYEFEELAAKDIDPSVAVTVRGGRAEENVSAVKRRDKAVALAEIAANPQMPKWLVEERLRLAGYEDADIRSMMSETMNSDQRNRASEAVESILEGKAAKVYQGADETFVRTVLDAAQRYTDSEGPEYDRLLAYAKAHVDIVSKNMAAELMREASPEVEQEQPEVMEQQPGMEPQAPTVALPQEMV